MNRSSPWFINRPAALAAIGLLLLVTTTPVGAQRSMPRAMRGLAAVTTAAAMGEATVIDVEALGLAPVALSGLDVGVSQVAVKDDIGVRVHLYFYNPGEQAITMPFPADSVFTLVDNKGRRLQLLHLGFENLPRHARELKIPALERATAVLLFYMPATKYTEGILKVAGAGAIRGLPLTEQPADRPATAPPPPPKADTTAVPPPP